MKNRSRWDPPGWPWELELLALVFVAAAILVPLYVEVSSTTDTSNYTLIEQAEYAQQVDARTPWETSTSFFWAVAILSIYGAHMVIAGTSINYISTSFTHLFAPLVFAGITYYRLLKVHDASGAAVNIVQGSVLEVVLWVLGILVITFLVARIRMARHMLNFRDIDWDLSTPTIMDKSYAQLLLQVQPLVYPPRVYRVCDQGILIEGWLYVLPITFSLVQSIDRIRGAGIMGSGMYLATSAESMVRIQLTESPDPIFISPKDVKPFLRYCKQHVQAMRPDTRAVETVSDLED